MKSDFIKSKEFKLFLTAWIIFVFYMQMYGSSHMANSQSALTASIVNERTFTIDTYYRATAGGVSFYDGHYYSIQSPGISFISVPLYVLGKPIFYILPQKLVDSIFEMLEKYGEALPVDSLGNKKIPSNYFPDLSKRQILEYLIIAGFLLPAFTTPLFSAITIVLLYSILKMFLINERLRMLITLFYAFGTLLFPLSTEFFQRPMAITFVLASFVILFKIRHKELKPKLSTTFVAGILAGLSAWFDYFHLLIAGLLFLYLLSSYRKRKHKKVKEANTYWIFELNKQRLLTLLSYIIGALIPVLLLFSYYYIAFDNPFTQSYAYTITPESIHKVSDISNIKFPSMITLLRMLGFFIYSPIIILALYGIYKALLKKDKHYHDAVAIGIFAISTLAYSSLISFIYPTTIALSFERYMTPIVPFIFIFIPYIFINNKLLKKNRMKTLFMIVGIISIFMNWTAAQYGGHYGLNQYDFNEKRFVTGVDFLKNGPSSSFLKTLAGIFNINPLLLNLIGLAALIALIYIIWRPYLMKRKHSY